MIDIELIRKQELDFFVEYCNKRHLDIEVIKDIKEFDKKTRIVQTKIQDNNALINKLSAQFASLVKNQEEDKLEELRKKVQILKQDIINEQEQYEILSKELTNKLLRLPNICAKDVPIGIDENENVVQKFFSKPTTFSFKPKPHWDLMVQKNLVDLEAAQYINGSRFVIYKGIGAKLIRALQWFTLDCNIDHGYLEILPPVIVDEQALYNTGQLPKFKEDLFELTQNNKFLSPTAEVQLTNLYANKILKEESLPLNFTANTSCFRSEAGSAGRDTRGVIRQHQFYKTELVKIVKPDTSEIEHEILTKNAEYILEALNLPYRRILLCSGDMGFSARKTYDLEVWLPSYNSYKEISSCSNCGDFQARRMKMRVKDSDVKIYYPHTLNGSALAIDRLFAAILENFQQEDGSILIPEVLSKYLNGIKKIL